MSAPLEEETISILDRDNPELKAQREALARQPIVVSNPTPPSTTTLPPITVEEDDSPDIVLPLIILIIFIAFLGWMLYLLFASGFQSTNPSDPVTSDNRAPNFLLCPTGSCAINLVSGIKTCPVSEDAAMPYDPSQSTCSGRFVCDNPLAPFAVQSDGSTNINGICEPNVECQCLNISQCPQYVLSAFTTSNGNPYISFANQRITFPQVSSYINSAGQVSTDPPIQYTNPSTTFCAAPMSWLPFSNPGCNFIGANQVNSMTYNDILICTNSVNGCDGFTGNPCLQGTLAAVTNSPDTLTQQNIVNAQFSCVAGEPCPCNYLAVYDTNYGGVVCRQLPP